MASSPQSAIEARGLVRRFGDFPAVAGIGLEVRHGEVFGLLGANGAGKTTAIRMLCGLLAPTEGEIRIAGIDMVRRPREARGRIGYVAQRFALYGDLTVRENLALQAGLYGLDESRAKSRIAWALAHLGLAGVERERAAAIPLGHQRRLAVAAALLHEPGVLFLDEPTSGIDPLARGEFWELVYELAESGAGVLVTTHYMDEALFCDRLALMHAGRIVAQGSPQELLARGVETPILEIESSRPADLAPVLAASGRLLEVVPHAGRIRARFRSDRDAQEIAQEILARAAKAGVPVGRVEPAAPELEDIVVGLLETHGSAP